MSPPRAMLYMINNIHNSKEEFIYEDDKNFTSLNIKVRTIENLDDENLWASFGKELWIYVKNFIEYMQIKTFWILENWNKQE